MTFEEFMATCRLTMRSGPDRVIVNHLGGAKTPDRAPIPEVVFVRDDGWSLGAPIGLIKAAEKMWADRWIGVLISGEPIPVTYEAWKIVHHPLFKLVP